MIPIRGIDHVVLRVRDLERMVAFYRDALGCEVVWRRPELGMVHVRAGGALIDLVTHDGPVGGRGRGAPSRDGHNMDHLCLRVDPFDAGAIAAHLAAHGVKAGEVRERFGAEGEGPSIYLDDPEGNTVELKGPARTWPAAARRAS
ncbi:MAG: VOC family protein [Burkholderiales bacterium]|nr:VOC family protein [Burkholderiales bacterium]